MKPTVFLCLCICLCFCLLFPSCASPLPEESSAPGESEEVSLPEDPNAKAVRADLEELLETEWSAGDDALEWLTSERAEAIRERVKKLKAPILTEEDAVRVAERAAAFYLAAWRGRHVVSLPACGVLAWVYRSTGMLTQYTEHAAVYNALLSYTLYLFTPPEYVFWGSEVWTEGWYPSSGQADPSAALCLSLAGAYTSRVEALTAIRESQSCIRLYPPFISSGARPLDFTDCEGADLLQGGACRFLELGATATRGDEVLRRDFRALYAETSAQAWLERIVYQMDTGAYGTYPFPNGEVMDVFLPLSAESAQDVREEAELMPAPILTEDLARILTNSMIDYVDPNLPTLLPDVENWVGSLLPQDREGGLLLPAGVEIWWQETSSMDAIYVVDMANGAAAYLIDLLTPSAYRFVDLTGEPGVYYALREQGKRLETPEEALRGFSAGERRFVLVTAECVPYLVDNEGNVERLDGRYA